MKHWGLGLLLILSIGCGDDGGDGGDAGPMEVDAATTDAGADGGAADTVAVQLLGINDFHGRLLPPDRTPFGGAAYLGGHIAARRETNPNTLFLSSGDLVGGSAFLSGVLHDEPTIAVMNAIGLDAAGDGNHEHDRTPAELARLFQGGCHPDDGCFGDEEWAGADFPLLAANVQSSEHSDLFMRWYTQRFDGVEVGVVGVTYAGTSDDILAANREGLVFTSEVAAVNSVVPELQEMGVETIVALMHVGGATALGGPCVAPMGAIFDGLAELDDAVDVVFGGHSHAIYRCEIDGRLVVSSGSFGQHFTDVDLRIDRATGDVVDATAELVAVTRDVTPHAEVQAILDDYEANLDDPVIGTITEDLSAGFLSTGQIPLGLVVADAYLARNEDAVMAFQNSGGVRATLSHEATGPETENGQVRRSELFATTPFSNQLLTISVTGAELRAWIEEEFRDGTPALPGLQPSAGVEIRFDGTRAEGERVTGVTLDGVAIEDATTYRVTVHDFILGRTEVLQERDLVYLGSDLDALTAYFEASSPISPPTEDRLVAE